jgi:hypothetical protein
VPILGTDGGHTIHRLKGTALYIGLGTLILVIILLIILL